MVAQIAAARLRIPGIVLLLLLGVILGPELLNVIRPQTLGPALSHIVGLSVAIILFEGGLALNFERLRGEAVVIRRLILTGALITAIGSAMAAHWLLGWTWPIAAVFGALLIVTGPTVIIPLLKRIRVNANVATILEAEAVMIDPIGAILAVVTLEIVLAETTGGAALHLVGLPTRLLLGAGVGAIGGIVIARLLKSERWLPEGYENILILSLVLALHEVSDAIQPESGILAATVAGLIVGNVRSRVARELRDFKDQLAVMLVGCLFILLAADVRLSSVIGLGWGGIGTVAVIMFVIRPLDIAASARGTTLTMKERAFMAWLSPRGIVAAAVASVFARRLTEAGMPVGEAFAAMVFLVIAVTVVVQGLSGGWVATKLGIRRPSEAGYIIVGANALGRRLGRALLDAGEDVALIDTNELDVRAAEADGLRVLYGNGHDEVVLQQADIEGRRGLIAVTPNEGANLVIAQQARTRYRVPTAFAALRRGKAAVTEESALESGVQVLFGGPIDLDRWIRLAASRNTSFTTWSSTEEEPADLGGVLTRVENAEHRSALPLLTRARGAGTPVSRRTQILPNSELTVLLAPSTDGDPARGGVASPA